MAARALLWWISFLTGFAGLLTQVVVARRAALWLGSSARASAAVLATFLLMLGLGSLWAARRPPSLVRAAACYAAVAVLVPLSVLAWEFLADPALGVAPDGAVAALLLLVLCAGLPALSMGAAWPALFAHAPAAGLNAANLFGAMAGAWLAGNRLLPELGYRASASIAAAVEALAALLLLLLAARSRPAPVVAVPADIVEPAGPRAPLFAVGLCGAATLGFEVLLLRRLPFFLEGFTPTFSAVLTAFLLSLALGSGLVAPLLRRLCRTHALWAAATIAALAIATTPLLLEQLRPAPVRAAGTSELGYAASLLGQAVRFAGPACLGLGACIPLALGVDLRPRVAARVFLALAVGEAGGALLVNHLVLPLCSADPYRLGFLPVAACAALAAAWMARGSWLLRMLPALVLLPVFAARARPPLLGSRYLSEERLERREILAHATDDTTTATVVWDKTEHQLLLYTDEFQAAATGRSASYMRVLGLLPFLLGAPHGRTAVLAIGTGTTANTVHACGSGPLHLVEVSRAVLALQHEFAAVAGSLQETLADSQVHLEVEDGRAFLLGEQAGSFTRITMEPLLPYAPGTVPLYTEEFYRLARSRLAAGGWLLQWIPAHAMPATFFRTLVKSFAQVFPGGSLWLFQNSVLLAGSPDAGLPSRAGLDRAFAGLPHVGAEFLRAGVHAPSDLGVAFVTSDLGLVAGDAPSLRDDRPWLERLGFWSGPQRDGFLAENLELLAQAAERDRTPGDWSDPRWRAPRLRRLSARLAAAGPRELRGHLLVEAEAGLSAACRALPDSLLLFRERGLLRAPVLVERAAEFLGLGRRAEAEALLVRAVEDWPEWQLPWQRLLELDPSRAAYQEQCERLDRSARLLVPPGDAAALDQTLAATQPVQRWPAWLAVRPERAAQRLAQRLADPHPPDPAALARCVAGRLDPWLWARLLEWAGRQDADTLAAFLTERVAGRCAVPAERALPEQFLAVVQARDPKVRAALAEVGLVGRKDPVAVELLLQLFLDPEPTVRQSAAIVLARSGLAAVTLDPEASAAERAAQAERFRAGIAR